VLSNIRKIGTLPLTLRLKEFIKSHIGHFSCSEHNQEYQFSNQIRRKKERVSFCSVAENPDVDDSDNKDKHASAESN